MFEPSSPDTGKIIIPDALKPDSGSTDEFVSQLLESISQPVKEGDGYTMHHPCRLPRTGVSDSGLVVTDEFIQTLREVGLESLANYYETMYKLAFE